MPLLLTVSCFNIIQSGFSFLVPAHLGSPGKGPLNGCVCVCVTLCIDSAGWLSVRFSAYRIVSYRARTAARRPGVAVVASSRRPVRTPSAHASCVCSSSSRRFGDGFDVEPSSDRLAISRRRCTAYRTSIERVLRPSAALRRRVL